jgi:glycosyltransferase 2 family protein
VKRWQFWVGVLISILFLWFALRGLHLGEVWGALLDARYVWLLPGVVAYFIAVWARAWRWHYLLRPLKRIPTGSMFPIVAIGYMGNNVYPARAGEVLRAYILRRREGVPISASLATIIVERAFDGLVMLGFVFLNLPELAGMTAASGFAGSIRSLALLGAAAFLGAVALFLLMAIRPTPWMRALGWLVERVLPERLRLKATALIERFLGGLAALRSPVDVFMVLLSSIVIWLLETGKYWFVMHAFPFEVSFFALMLMNGIVNLATTLPSAPGYIGTFDAPGIAVLQAYGVAPPVAASYTLALHAALWLPITALGAFYMARESLSWNRVQAEIAGEAGV